MDYGHQLPFYSVLNYTNPDLYSRTPVSLRADSPRPNLPINVSTRGSLLPQQESRIGPLMTCIPPFTPCLLHRLYPFSVRIRFWARVSTCTPRIQSEVYVEFWNMRPILYRFVFIPVLSCEGRNSTTF